ncbi:MAG: hypothetical protein HY007_04230 [Candidatus Sungbacteria bacterium]|nr:hypothetical protein [Candidatus Sungbacteria bacterium]
MQKTTITQFIIERLYEASEVSNALFPRKWEHRHFTKLLLDFDSRRKITPATISSILSRLKRQGLVARSGSTRNSLWRVTREGKNRHDARRRKAVPPKNDGITRLVIFDIPEYERRKRTAIRTELVGCNFRPLQKSVWIGTSPLPEDFITLLDELELKNKVHIFSVRGKGTLDKI